MEAEVSGLGTEAPAARAWSVLTAVLVVACGWAAFLPIGAKYLAYLGCGAAALLALRRSGRLGELARDGGFRAVAAFWGFTLLSVLWSEGSARDIVGQLWLYGLLLLAPLISLACPPALARRVLRQFGIAAAAIGAAVALAYAGALPDSMLWHSTVQAEGNQRIVTSLVLALGAAIAAVEALRCAPGRRAERLGWLIGVALAVLGLALQDRRTGMVALPVLLAVLGLARLRSWTRGALLLAAVAGLSIAAWQFSPGVRARIDEGLNEVRHYQSSDTDATSWGMRLRLAEHTLDMVRERPVAGHGVGSWLVQWRQRVQPGLVISIHTTPHNEYLLIASQLGLIGIALLLWLLGRQAWTAWRAGDAGLAALLAWTAIGWTGFFNVVLRDGKFALPLLLVAALSGAVQRVRESPPSRHTWPNNRSTGAVLRHTASESPPV